MGTPAVNHFESRFLWPPLLRFLFNAAVMGFSSSDLVLWWIRLFDGSGSLLLGSWSDIKKFALKSRHLNFPALKKLKNPVFAVRLWVSKKRVGLQGPPYLKMIGHFWSPFQWVEICGPPVSFKIWCWSNPPVCRINPQELLDFVQVQVFLVVVE